MSDYIRPHMRKALAGHMLTCLVSTDEVHIYRMARPGVRAYCVLLAFTPEGIFIQGDVALGRDRGGIGTPVYKSLEWFAGQLSADYLCSKFLSKAWQREVASRDIVDQLHHAEQELAEACEDELRYRGLGEDDVSDEELHASPAVREYADAVEGWREVQDCLRDEVSEHEIYEVYSKYFCDFLEYCIGYDYPLDDAGWLCAIQERFSQLFHAAPEAL